MTQTRPDSPRRILVVFKASKLERYIERGSLKDAREEDNDEDLTAVYDRLRLAHEQHERSVTRTEEVLESLGLEIIRASEPRKRDVARADLVVSVGGDGTFLWTARKVADVPMLGINSAPGTSTGHYCGATTDDLAEVLDGILSRRAAPRPLTRIRAEVDGRVVPYPALNDVLFAHRSPAASSRYLLRIGDRPELHVSSGVWVCTASGSSGAMLSAGGQRMEAGDPRLQYKVREPYQAHERALALLQGFTADGLTLVSRSPSNAIFLDGHSVTYTAGFGAKVTLRPDDAPLLVYGYPER